MCLAKSINGKVSHIVTASYQGQGLYRVRPFDRGLCGYAAGSGSWMVVQRTSRDRICARCLEIARKNGLALEFYATVVDEPAPVPQQMVLL